MGQSQSLDFETDFLNPKSCASRARLQAAQPRLRVQALCFGLASCSVCIMMCLHHGHRVRGSLWPFWRCPLGVAG